MKTIDELNINLISKRIPQIIHGVHEVINKRKEFFYKIVKEINTDYELFLKWKHELLHNAPTHKSDSEVFAANIDIHKLRYSLDPVSFIGHLQKDEDLLGDYYRFDQNHMKENYIYLTREIEDLDPSLRALGNGGYLLKNINICNMGVDPQNELLSVPRIQIRSLVKTELTEFMNYQDNINSDKKGYFESYLLDGSFSQIDQQYENKNLIKEFMIGQISLHDISAKLMTCYKKALDKTYFSFFHSSMNSEESKEMCNKLNAFITAQQVALDLPNATYFNNEEYEVYYKKTLAERSEWTIAQYGQYLKNQLAGSEISYFQTLDNLNPYLVYLFVSHFLDENNCEKLELEDEKEFAKRLKENFEIYLESLIARTTISMIATYFAKISLDEQRNPLETTHEIIKTLMNETCEDVAALSKVLKYETEFENVGDKRSLIIKETDDVFNNRKIGKILRTRLHDYFMLSYLAQNRSKKNYNLSNYFKQNEFLCRYDSINHNLHNGSKFYNFVYLLLQEIYAHKTVVSNFRQNISGFKNGNFTYINTFSFAAKKMKKYIDSFYKKEYINDLFMTAWDTLPNDTFQKFSVEKKIEYLSLNTPNIYSFNTLKNHRAVSSILKKTLHYVLKLYYIAGSYQEMVKKESIMKVPSYIREKYLNTAAEIKNLITTIQREIVNENLIYNNRGAGNNLLQGQDLFSSDFDRDDFTKSTTQLFYSKRWFDIYRNHCKNLQPSSSSVGEDVNRFNMSDICILTLDNSIENYLVASEFVLPYEVKSFIEGLVSWSNTNADPELFAINPDLIQSREELESFKKEAFEKNTLFYDYNKINQSFEEYIKNTKANELSIESILAFSLMAESCDQSVNNLTASLEQINEKNRNNEKFENLFNKAMDRYRLN